MGVQTRPFQGSSVLLKAIFITVLVLVLLSALVNGGLGILFGLIGGIVGLIFGIAGAVLGAVAGILGAIVGAAAGLVALAVPVLAVVLMVMGVVYLFKLV